MEYSSEFPLSIVKLFYTEAHLAEVMNTVIDELQKLVVENGDDKEYIPPVVYSEVGKAFNVDYDFLVYCISYHVSDESLAYDFGYRDGANQSVKPLAHFLVRGILEDYFGVVKINTYRVDTSRYRSNKPIEIHRRFHNVLGLKRGANVRRFAAVPFNRIALSKVVGEGAINSLLECAEIAGVEQVFFMETYYQEYLRTNRVESVLPVYSIAI